MRALMWSLAAIVGVGAVVLVGGWVFVSCEADRFAHRMAAVKIGMTESEVLNALGQPSSVEGGCGGSVDNRGLFYEFRPRLWGYPWSKATPQAGSLVCLSREGRVLQTASIAR